MNDNLDQLIQQEVDGANSPEETAELTAALASDPQVALRLSEYRALAASVAELPMADTPSGFTDRVMASLPPPAWASQASRGFAGDRSASRARAAKTSFLDWLAGPRIRLAYAFAAGVLLAVTGTLSLVGPRADPGAATGTIVTNRPDNVSERVSLGDASIVATRNANGMELLLEIPEGTRLALRSTGAFSTASVSWPDLPSIAPESAITVGPGSISVAGGLGQIFIDYARSGAAPQQSDAPDDDVVSAISVSVDARLFRGNDEIARAVIPLPDAN